MSRSSTAAFPRPSPATWFSVQTDAEPTTLARVLEVFALREVLPTRFESVLDRHPNGEAPADRLTVDIQVADLGQNDAAAIARKLAAVVGVRAVRTAERVLDAPEAAGSR